MDAVSLSASTPVVLILFNAGPLDVSWAQNNPRVAAILEAFFPAQATGEALRMVLLNEGFFGNPAGRLPATWPMTVGQYPPITDYTMVNRTYRYKTSDNLYSFGYGLSYSKFRYLSLDIFPAVVKNEEFVNFEVFVANDGPHNGEEVIQVYVTWMNKTLPSPNIQLIAFNRYFVLRGETVVGSFKVPLGRLAVWNDSPAGFNILKGEYQVYAGGQQPGQKTSAPSNILTGHFTIA
jgi:beta-glucosidase